MWLYCAPAVLVTSFDARADAVAVALGSCAAQCQANGRSSRCGSSRFRHLSPKRWRPRRCGRLRRNRRRRSRGGARGGAASNPASAVSASPFPTRARIAKTVFGWSTSAGRAWKSTTCPPRHEQILPPIVVEIIETHAEAGHLAAGARACRSAWSPRENRPCRCSETAGNVWLFNATKHNIGIAIVVEVAEIQAHAGNKAAIFQPAPLRPRRRPLRTCSPVL